jgi:hypothetical protein
MRGQNDLPCPDLSANIRAYHISALRRAGQKVSFAAAKEKGWAAAYRGGSDRSRFGISGGARGVLPE